MRKTITKAYHLPEIGASSQLLGKINFMFQTTNHGLLVGTSQAQSHVLSAGSYCFKVAALNYVTESNALEDQQLLSDDLLDPNDGIKFDSCCSLCL
jgi:hypothetical protein